MGVSDGERRRRIGREIRRRRSRSGLTQYDVGRSLSRAQTTISAFEKGERTPNRNDLDALDRLFNTDGALLALWDSLGQADGYAPWFRDIAVIEGEASEIRTYQPLAIPGLFQAPEYVRAVTEMGSPWLPAEKITEAVDARVQRQEILSAESGPVVRAVVEEHVLRRPIGGRVVLKAQLDQLLTVAAQIRVTLQVIPMTSEQHHGIDGAFSLYTVPGKGHLAYTETRVTSDPRSDQDTIDSYMGVFGDLCADALPPAASRAFIEQIRSEFEC
ncbi:helix-turn-helix transcriptional regulator [Lipingzhangella sp. LS1_29]|uniref:Helix-turn-helix transcriptional regulator n=1 Tax=Lipingzhangella rawalii TaxID=2055835 RepID=A0ABU2H5Z3_9ACTN|nr:helix-turn-helix transcriptional regulator [Lipingzhangella rawalii]MDS1270734.1 helix-turn-helix transcriptional regulator [Lipingzhangella rawalii]